MCVWAFTVLDVVGADGGFEGGVDFQPTLQRDVRVLAAPDHEQLAGDLGDAVEGVIVHPGAEAALVDVGGVKAGGGENAGPLAAPLPMVAPIKTPTSKIKEAANAVVSFDRFLGARLARSSFRFSSLMISPSSSCRYSWRSASMGLSDAARLAG